MSPKDRDRLLKFCRLLASDQDGERGTAASMANKLAEQLGGWDKVIAGASQPEQQSHSMWHSPRHDYREEMRLHEAWVRQQAEAFKREMGKNAERQREEAERMRAAKAAAQNTDWSKVDPTQRQRYDDNFNQNFSAAHAQGHSFNNAFGQGSQQWTEDDIEKMKRELEDKMREKGLWKDGI